MKIKRSFSLDLSLPVLVLIGISAWAVGPRGHRHLRGLGVVPVPGPGHPGAGFCPLRRQERAGGRSLRTLCGRHAQGGDPFPAGPPGGESCPVHRPPGLLGLPLGLRGQPLLLLALLPFLLEILPLPKLLRDEYLSEVLRRAGALAAGVALFALSLLALLGVRGLEMMAGVYTVFYLSLVLYLYRWLRSTEGDAVDS